MLPIEETRDIWDLIKVSERPIVVYGMGNGADKLIERLRAYGRTVSCICASEEFVRGQSFHGMRVVTPAMAKEQYPDALWLIAFGTRLPEVLHRLEAIAADVCMYVPDLPVCGGQYFDLPFYRAHTTELETVYDCLSDALSRHLFVSLIRYKLTGAWDVLMSHTSSSEDMYTLCGRSVTCAMDIGAYRGDTAAEMIDRFPRLQRLIAVEPDRRSFNKLTAFAARYPVVEVHHAAVSDTVGQGTFFGSGNRNASLCASSHAYREEPIPLVTVDTLAEGISVDYIKYDVEGAEYAALQGSANTVARCRPILRVAAYHRSEDLFRLPLLLRELCPSYCMYLRRTPCIPAWEADILCIPKERTDCV